MMCEWHGGTYVGNATVRLCNGATASVDRCIQPIVQAINDAGLLTLNSCCGHGQRPGWVVLSDGREVLIAPDYETARRMDHSFPALRLAKPDGEAARDMTAAERLRMERETAAVHRAFDAVFAPRHSQWKGDK